MTDKYKTIHISSNSILVAMSNNQASNTFKGVLGGERYVALWKLISQEFNLKKFSMNGDFSTYYCILCNNDQHLETQTHTHTHRKKPEGCTKQKTCAPNYLSVRILCIKLPRVWPEWLLKRTSAKCWNILFLYLYILLLLLILASRRLTYYCKLRMHTPYLDRFHPLFSYD